MTFCRTSKPQRVRDLQEVNPLSPTIVEIIQNNRNNNHKKLALQILHTMGQGLEQVTYRWQQCRMLTLTLLQKLM